MDSLVAIGSHSKAVIADNQVPLDQVPEELIYKIFSFLNVRELLLQSSLVCWYWKDLAADKILWKTFDLKEIFPKLSIIDRSIWEQHFDLKKHGISIDDEPPIDNHTLIPILKKFDSLPIEQKGGFTLLTIPKGLTLNKLIALARSQEGKKLVEFIYPAIVENLGDIAVDQTYRILISDHILEESRGLSESAQKDLVDTFGCESANLLPMLALLVTTFVSSGKRLYGKNPLTTTRCQEQVNSTAVLIGTFGPNGFTLCTDGKCNFKHKGIAATLKV